MIIMPVQLTSMFKIFLKKEGYDVTSFSDPLMALKYFRYIFDKHFLVITDLMMPSMSGIELAKRIRMLNSEIKIFFDDGI